MAAKIRTKDGRRHDLVRVSELALQQRTAQEIADILFTETGTRLSRRQIAYDIKTIREEWQNSRLGNYDSMVNESLAKLDILEKEAWLLLTKDRDARPTRVRTVTKKRPGSVNEDGELSEMDVVEVTEIIDNDDNEFSPLLQRILEIQAERNKLLGLYPSRKVDVNQQITVKGYSVVANPENWPGEIVEEYYEPEKSTVPRLASGSSEYYADDDGIDGNGSDQDD